MLKRLRTILSAGIKTAFASGGSVVSNTLAGIPLARLRDYQSYLEAGTKKIWASWKACDVTAETVMDTPFRIVNQNGNELNNSELARITSYPNRWETWNELIYISVMHLKFTGSAFWYKSDANVMGERPKEVFWLNPKRVKIIPGKQDKIAGYLYTVNGRDIPFDPSEIMHFKRPHPDNDYWGLGDFEAGETLLNEAINHDTWTQKFWENGAAPSGLLTTEEEPADEASFRKLKADFQKQYGGAKNSGKIAWLTGKWVYQQMGMTARDLQDLEKTKWTTEQIFMLHGVPLSVAGVQSAANFATAKLDDIRFRKYTVKPLIRILEDTINTDLINGFAKGAKLRYRLTGLINTTELVTDHAPLFDRGVLSINDFREILNLERLEDDPIFDQHFLNAGLVPIDLAGISMASAIDPASIVKRFIGSSDERLKQMIEGDAKTSNPS